MRNPPPWKHTMTNIIETEPYVDIEQYVAIICNMRFMSLFLILNIVLCYSGICFAGISLDEGAKEMSSHCDMKSHNDDNGSDTSQVFIRSLSPADYDNSQCCYEGLTNSSVKTSLDSTMFAVLYTKDLPDHLKSNSSKKIDYINTGSFHDPPDIYLSVSRFLL